MIITQETKNDINKTLNDMIVNKLTDIISKEIKNTIINGMNNTNAFNIILGDLNNIFKKNILDILKTSLETIDEKYRDSEERKARYYISVRYDPRSILTKYGEFYMKRTYYVDKNKKNGFYFIDDVFDIEPYKRFSADIRAKAISLAIKTNQKLGGELVEDVTDNKNLRISRNTIYNWLDEWKLPKIKYQSKETPKVLNIMLDEKYIHEQMKEYLESQLKNDDKIETPADKKEEETATSVDSKTLFEIITETIGAVKSKIINTFKSKKKSNNEKDSKRQIVDSKKSKDKIAKKEKHYIMSRQYVVFSGIEKKGKRTILKDRKIFMTASKNSWKDFIDNLCEMYDYEKIEKINVFSDAGKWIMAGVPELKLYSSNEIIHNLCIFHVKQKISRTTNKLDLQNNLYQCVIENRKKDFKEQIEKIKESKSEARKSKIDEYANYILNHWKSILNTISNDIGSSMESHISHYTASYFASRPKAYGKKHIEKLLKLQEYKVNGIDIERLYMVSYRNTSDEEPLVIDEKNLSLPLSYNDKKETTTLTIIGNGHVDTLYSTLKGLTSI